MLTVHNFKPFGYNKVASKAQSSSCVEGSGAVRTISTKHGASWGTAAWQNCTVMYSTLKYNTEKYSSTEKYTTAQKYSQYSRECWVLGSFSCVDTITAPPSSSDTIWPNSPYLQN